MVTAILVLGLVTVASSLDCQALPQPASVKKTKSWKKCDKSSTEVAKCAEKGFQVPWVRGNDERRVLCEYINTTQYNFEFEVAYTKRIPVVIKEYQDSEEFEVYVKDKKDLMLKEATDKLAEEKREELTEELLSARIKAKRYMVQKKKLLQKDLYAILSRYSTKFYDKIMEISATGDSTVPEPECTIDNEQTDYRGTTSITKSGKTCQKWSVSTAHEPWHVSQRKTVLEYPGLGDHNYCRNPYENYPGTEAWCYTTDPATTWEYCTIPKCQVGTSTYSPWPPSSSSWKGEPRPPFPTHSPLGEPVSASHEPSAPDGEAWWQAHVISLDTCQDVAFSVPIIESDAIFEPGLIMEYAPDYDISVAVELEDCEAEGIPDSPVYRAVYRTVHFAQDGVPVYTARFADFLSVGDGKMRDVFGDKVYTFLNFQQIANKDPIDCEMSSEQEFGGFYRVDKRGVCEGPPLAYNYRNYHHNACGPVWDKLAFGKLAVTVIASKCGQQAPRTLAPPTELALGVEPTPSANLLRRAFVDPSDPVRIYD